MKKATNFLFIIYPSYLVKMPNAKENPNSIGFLYLESYFYRKVYFNFVIKQKKKKEVDSRYSYGFTLYEKESSNKIEFYTN